MFQAMRSSESNWSELPEIPVSSALHSVLGGQAGGLNGRLYAQVNLMDGTAPRRNSIMQYDDVSRSWSELSRMPEVAVTPSGPRLTGNFVDLPAPSSLAASEEALYTTLASNAVGRFDLSSNEWVLMPSPPAQVERLAASSGVLLARTDDGRIRRLGNDMARWHNLPDTGVGGTIHHMSAGPDGEVYVAIDSGSSWTVMRHRPNQTGWTTLPVPGGYHTIFGVSVDSDGGMMLTGASGPPGGTPNLVVDRLESDDTFTRVAPPAPMAGFNPTGAPPRASGGGATAPGQDVFRTRATY